MMKLCRRLAVVLCAAATAGCAVGPEYHAPQPEVPARWSEVSQNTAPAPSVQLPWWSAFNDPELDSLIDRAMRSNLDLQSAETHIVAARANRGVAAGARWPVVAADGSYARERESANAPTLGPPGESENLFQAGFDAKWELDLFGGARRATEAAQAELESTYFGRGAVLVTLQAEVVRNYIELRARQQQLGVTQDILDVGRDMLSLAQSRYQGGLVTDFDVARVEAEVAEIAASMPPMKTSIRDTMRRLSVLLGQAPGALDEELGVRQRIPVAPDALPTGLPSDLLRRRPDIRRAERQLAAANARIGVATADLYPKFSLLGVVGLNSSAAGNFFNGDSRYWSIGPSFNWPIFQGGRVVATIRVREAERQQALIAYRQSILGALEDAENAIGAYTREERRRTILADDVNSNQRAAARTHELYLSGLCDFRSVLDARRKVLTAQGSLLQSEGVVAVKLVALYKALGGGLDSESLPFEAGSDRPNATGARVAKGE